MSKLGYRSLNHVGGIFHDAHRMPQSLTDKGDIIGSDIHDSLDEDRDREAVAFAEGAEFGAVAQAMMTKRGAFACIVRASILARLITAAEELYRDIALDEIPDRENPLGLYARIRVGKRIEYAEGEGPAV